MEDIINKILDLENSNKKLKELIFQKESEQNQLKNSLKNLDTEIENYKCRSNDIEELVGKLKLDLELATSISPYAILGDKLPVAYIRESKKHSNGESQKSNIGDFLKCDSVIYFTDVISGYSDPTLRPGFSKLLEFINENNIKVVYVNSLERLGRTTEVILKAINSILNFSTIIYDVRNNIEITPDNLSSNLDKIKAIGDAANFEGKLIHKRLDEGLKAAKKRGVVVGRPAGNCETYDDTKKKYPTVINYLKAGKSVRVTARETKTGISTVQRIRNKMRDNKDL